jgi:hypothetical protein
VRRFALVLALVLVALVLGACAGDDEDEEATPTVTTSGPPPPATPIEAVIAFLTAVETRNDQRAWRLVSEETIVAFEYNIRHFESNIAPALRSELRLDRRVLFSEQFGERALVVLADAQRAGGPLAWSLHREDGGWRVELFYPQFVATLPQENETLRAGRYNLLFDVVRRQNRGVRTRLWLDGKPIRIRIRDKGKFVITYTAPVRVTKGEHTLIAYATTSEGLAGGHAWRFTGK